MHYANGRPAQNGDRVFTVGNGLPMVGVLHDATAGNEYCNGYLAPLIGGPGACLADCLRLDDVLAALGIPPNCTDVRAALAKVAKTEAGSYA